LIHFVGKGDFQHIHFDLEYSTSGTQTELEVQEALVMMITSGISPYVAQKRNLPGTKLPGSQESTTNTSPLAADPHDSWRKWVFDIGVNVGYEMESDQKDLELEGNIRARHTSEKWRIRSELEYDYEHREIIQEHINFIHSIDRVDFEGSVVRSLSEHWSAGAFLDASRNISRNLNQSFRLNAALEWNLFPYTLSHQKEFTIAYYAGPVYMNYVEETIYDKQRESLLGHQLSVNYRLKKTWGSLDARLDGFQYINDPSKHRITLDAGARIRIANGLSLRIYGEYQLIHDQTYLPKGSASLEDILLKRRSIATDFSLDFYVGLVYTFGSVYNSIVNTRL
jgi:hypothetical protein